MLFAEDQSSILIDSPSGRNLMLLFAAIGTFIGFLLMMLISAIFRVKKYDNRGLTMAYSESLFILVFLSVMADPYILSVISAALSLLFWVLINWMNNLNTSGKPNVGN